MHSQSIEILCVNYNTPDLIERLLNSWVKWDYNEIPIHIIDGSDNPVFAEKVKDICKIDNVKLTQRGYNVHHGNGLHFCIIKSPKEFQFLMDSDSSFKKCGLFDAIDIPSNYFGIGNICKVDKDGYNVTEEGISYLHPNCCVISKEKYLKSERLINHGAPFINTMKHMKYPIKDISELAKEYLDYGGGETVRRFGYSPCRFVR